VIRKSRRAVLDRMRDEWSREVRVRLLRKARANQWDTDADCEGLLERMGHLAGALSALQKLYHKNLHHYDARSMADLLNALIRSWPGVTLDGRLSSMKALEARGTAEPVVPEHDSPISFFRDMLLTQKRLSRADWHYLISRYLRVRHITVQEDRALTNAGYKQNRPLSAYEEVGIKMSVSGTSVERRLTRIINGRRR